jgi:AraC family transcriptional regulator, activator of mtrCDE
VRIVTRTVLQFLLAYRRKIRHARDQLDHKLKSALAELVSQAIGFGAMSVELLEQVILVLLRRSISSMQSWVERFSMLRDPQIARAFLEMAVQPGRHHSLLIC